MWFTAVMKTKPANKRTTVVRVSEDLHRKLKITAALRGTTIEKVTAEILEGALR